MENASKALLIAAAILIAILLIAMGMKIFNSTTGTTDSLGETINATEVEIFNNNFDQYVGNNKSKAQVISLLNKAIVNNSKETNRKIKINGESTISSLQGKLNELGDGPFKIIIDAYTTKEGYIENIAIYYIDSAGKLVGI